jgi:transcription elongation factor GreB
MSRAFVNEDAGNDRPDLPERPVPPGPNIVTPRGLATLQAQLAQRKADLTALKSRPDRLDKLPEAAAERDLRWLEARLKAAVVIDPAAHDLTEVAFGLRATLHRIAPNSPLARALLGAQVGDEVTWRRPVGATPLTIIRISHADPHP